jgi:hypothetical protein
VATLYSSIQNRISATASVLRNISTDIVKNTNGDNHYQDRVLNLYGREGFETWEKIGKRLRLNKRGSAWSLAHGLRAMDERTLEYLEAIEWGIENLDRAVENLTVLWERNGG